MKTIKNPFLYFRIKIRQFLAENKKNNHLKSYSQFGEDIIVKSIFQLLGISKPTFLDIGAHHPYYLSNTALLYNSGSRGINVEANPLLMSKFRKVRSRDLNLNVGISEKNDKMDFYVIQDSTLSTFSEAEAQSLKSFGHKCVKVESIETLSINELLDSYNLGMAPDFLTLDAEGYDYQILKTLDFSKYSPKVICVEIVEYSPNGNGKRKDEILNLLTHNGYFEYANTHINGIFVKCEFFQK